MFQDSITFPLVNQLELILFFNLLNTNILIIMIIMQMYFIIICYEYLILMLYLLKFIFNVVIFLFFLAI